LLAAKSSPAFVQTGLARLDRLLAAAADRASEVYGPNAARDSFRGLYLNADDFERLLTYPPGEPLLWTGDAPALAEELGLSAFDLDVLLLAVAPELDLKYERLFGFLQDDVTRKRPTVDLALHVLCPSAELRLLRREHFSPEAPLFARRLLRLVADPSQVEPPLLAHYLKAEPQALGYLMGQAEGDARLVPFCRLSKPDDPSEASLDGETFRGLVRAVETTRLEQAPLRLFLEGPRGAGQAETAGALAAAMCAPLYSADLDRATECRADLETLLPAIFAEAKLRGALLYIEGFEAAPRLLLESLVEQRREATILAGPRAIAGWLPFSTAAMGAKESRRRWQRCAAAEGVELDAETIDSLSARLRLTPRQIAQTVRGARRQAALQGRAGVEMRDVMSAAKVYTGHELAALARKVQARRGWDDLVLPGEAESQLREMCQRVGQRSRVLQDWGFEAKAATGSGVTALFAGPSGSGKTMAVEILSRELALDAYRIDLSGVVSKYIGETEKNLDRIFNSAENANAILFFDEADALFGKRSEVRDSHDRYANIEISYLLQKMEEYSGIAILATNLRQNLDDAFVRRLTFAVHFPFPDEASRARIWKGIWPARTPLSGDVDCDRLARQFALSGGNIRNIALAAAFLAADEGEVVAMRHVLHATRREYQKYGNASKPGVTLEAMAEGVPA
jgi:ATPase family associated with various cellular activities (AAA)